ncbi:plexin-B1 [Pseudoliparis swirei]|uniref:plexin-B1 n=1 Tax=Pseudoliparis swirei TaxID=2059687 RepID=UPI0024BD8982|nr:plexin-B1 [Pseudoliparis swirei]
MLASSTPPVLLLLLLLLLPPHPSSCADVTVTSDPLVRWGEEHGDPLSHLVLEAGHLYVGGVDHLYQLTSDLEVVSHVRTGPYLDSPDCLPPIVPQDCPSATPTHNHNKLLLVEAGQGAGLGSLIVCGSLFQGICDKRSLSNLSHLLYQTSNPVDTQYVAANDPRVSTVAVVITTENKQEVGVAGGALRLMLVGRGYTGRGPGDIPPVTTRRLSPVAPPRRAFAQEEELGKLVVGSYSEYNNHFVKAVAHGDHVYFLFSRRDMWHKKEYRTYAARLCAADRSFYSYVEAPLLCRGGYNLAQGAWLGSHGAEPALFVVAAGQATPVYRRSAPAPDGMKELDAVLRGVCVLQVPEAAQGPLNPLPLLDQDSLSEYPCGGEHTPNPIASAVPLPATPTFTSSTQLTAVTTATEAGHTIAFLGDAEGRLHKVLVRSDWSGDLYGSVSVDKGSGVRADLLLDDSQQHVFVLTNRKLSKVPVSTCERQTDCQSCLSFRDPYCGWCVLEGRCSRKHQCQRHMQPNHWLWSFEPTNQCVTVQSVRPANQSKDEQTQVTLSVVQLPVLEAESLSCVFGLLPPEPAVVTATSITCQSPAPELLPLMLTGSVSYSTSSQCLACVSSVWRCNWCPLDQLCTHNHSCANQHIILNQRESSSPTSCPLVFALQSSALVPLGLTSTVVLRGQNLDVYTDEAQYVCVVQVEGVQINLTAAVEKTHNTHTFTCRPHQFQYAVSQLQNAATVYLRRGERRIDTSPGLRLQLYDCSAGQSDCSQCRAVPEEYGCVWCSGSSIPSCVYNQSCTSVPADTCPPPQITHVLPVSGPLEGGVLVTITGSNLGMRYQDVVGGVTVAGVQCPPQPEGYQISTRVVCELQSSGKQREGPVLVTVGTTPPGKSKQIFTFQDPQLRDLVPDRGPVSGGTRLTIRGRQLLTGQESDLSVFLGLQPCFILEEVTDSQLVCQTGPSNQTADVSLRVFFGKAERTVPNVTFRYLDDPVITDATPAESFYEGGRVVLVTGRNLGVVQQPIISVWVEPLEVQRVKRRRRLALLTAKQLVFNSSMTTVSERCSVLSSTQMTCPSPKVSPEVKVKGVWFQLDNVRVHYETIKVPVSRFFPLVRPSSGVPLRFKPGACLSPQGQDLTRAMSRQEVRARLGDQECEVKTLDSTHLYCEPPERQPISEEDGSELPSLQVFMGNLRVDLGLVQYDSDSLSVVPLAAQVGLGAGAAVIILSVLVVILMYRRKSKQALRDYKKVLLQLETLEINVGDQCRKEFTDLMTEMMDLSTDVGGPGLPLLDYKTYAERVFFPGQQAAPLSRQLDLPESRRPTVEQGLQQLGSLLNNRLFLTRFIHTLEAQQGFSQRDRGSVASLLTMALHDQLEYFTEVMKTLLQDLVQQYVSKNPKLMLRRYVDLVPGSWSSPPYWSLGSWLSLSPPQTLMVLVKNGVEVQPSPVKVLDADTITQVKDKILDQVYRGAPFTQRPAADSLDLEWRSGQAGHLTLSDDDVTAVVQGRWKRINTLQHYKVSTNHSPAPPLVLLLFSSCCVCVCVCVSVCRYYSDIHSSASGCYQEMNSTLNELSGSFASEMNSMVALHELYKYINKYYDQIIMSLEEDSAGQKMQLAYRLQQVVALVENKVTDL